MRCGGARGDGRAYQLEPGDGAFYGPKIDFHVTDSIGRQWQLGTIQLDYNAPERFDLTYVGEDNAPHRPVVIHRAVCGSFERFIAILIEHYAGAFPTWLAPEQVRVLPISEQWTASAEELLGSLDDAGVRATLEARETLNYRIREAESSRSRTWRSSGSARPRRHGGRAAARGREEAGRDAS
jgi:threonyl-tRNA synthetase